MVKQCLKLCASEAVVETSLILVASRNPHQPFADRTHTNAPHHGKGIFVVGVSTSFHPFKFQVSEAGSYRVTHGFGHISLALKSSAQPITEMTDFKIGSGLRDRYVTNRQILLTLFNTKVQFPLFLHCAQSATDPLCDGFDRWIRRP